MYYLVAFVIVLLVSYFLGRLSIKNKLINDKYVDYSKLPTLYDFIKVGFMVTGVLVFIIGALLFCLFMLFKIFIVAIPVLVIIGVVFVFYYLGKKTVNILIKPKK